MTDSASCPGQLHYTRLAATTDFTSIGYGKGTARGHHAFRDLSLI